MIEVFKTNVNDTHQAEKLLDHLGRIFPGYKINFDLDDRDRILRVECGDGSMDTSQLIDVVRTAGFAAEVLPDELPLVSEWQAGVYRFEN